MNKFQISTIAVFAFMITLATVSNAQDDVKVLEEVLIVGAIKSKASQASTNVASQDLAEIPVIVE